MRPFVRLLTALALAVPIAVAARPAHAQWARITSKFDGCHYTGICFAGTVTQERRVGGTPVLSWDIGLYEGPKDNPDVLYTFAGIGFLDFLTEDGKGSSGSVLATSFDDPPVDFVGSEAFHPNNLVGSGGRRFPMPLTGLHIQFFALQEYLPDPDTHAYDWEEHIGFGEFETTFTPTPEPGTWALLGTGLLAMGGIAARQRRRANSGAGSCSVPPVSADSGGYTRSHQSRSRR